MRTVRLHHVILTPFFDVIEDGEVLASGPAMQGEQPVAMNIPGGALKVGDLLEQIEKLRVGVEELLNAEVEGQENGSRKKVVAGKGK